MSASCPGPALPISAIRSPASTRMPDKIAALQTRRDSDLRARPRRTRRDQHQGRAARIHHRSRRPGGARPTRCSSRSERRRAAATVMPISAMSTPRRARSPRQLDGFTVVVTKSTVPVGTGDEVERIIREARPDADCRGRLQSGIPARGRGDPGFQASRPHRGRHRRRARARR